MAILTNFRKKFGVYIPTNKLYNLKIKQIFKLLIFYLKYSKCPNKTTFEIETKPQFLKNQHR